MNQFFWVLTTEPFVRLIPSHKGTQCYLTLGLSQTRYVTPSVLVACMCYTVQPEIFAG